MDVSDLKKHATRLTFTTSVMWSALYSPDKGLTSLMSLVSGAKIVQNWGVSWLVWEMWH